LGGLAVSITPPIRHRLVTVVLLGVLTSGLSLVALLRLLSTAVTARVERARDNIGDELARFAAEPGDHRKTLAESPWSQVIGMRGGYTTAAAMPDDAVPVAWRAPLAQALAEAARTHALAILEAPLPEARLVAGATPAKDGTLAWAAYPIRYPPYLDNWRWIVLALAVVTLLLAASAVHAVIVVKRGAGALNAALGALATDLTIPVPRPPVRELSDIADGIAKLAERLAQARKAEARLGRELSQQERLAALGRVVAGVAHEVRNPLASIKLRLDLSVSSGPELPAALHNAVSHASAEIARLDRLVADLLVVAGRSIGPQRPTSLGLLVRERVEALAPWAQLRRVGVAVDGDGPALVNTDALARAFDNLLRNAVEASPQGGLVSVRILESHTQMKILIEDRGPGVAGERAAELFEPFFTTKGDGTGLGLAISRAIARAHGGDVVYRREGATTCFELSLPRAVESAAGEAASDQHAMPA
jgi:signal transduction histidine kinase